MAGLNIFLDLLDEVIEEHLREHVARPGLSDAERKQAALERSKQRQAAKGYFEDRRKLNEENPEKQPPKKSFWEKDSVTVSSAESSVSPAASASEGGAGGERRGAKGRSHSARPRPGLRQRPRASSWCRRATRRASRA